MILLLIIIIVAHVQAIINPYGPTVVSDFSACVNKLIITNFKLPGNLVFGTSETASSSTSRIRDDLLRKIHQRAIYAVEMLTPNDETPICEENSIDGEDLNVIHRDFSQSVPTADYVVIVTENLRDFKQIGRSLISSSTWNPVAKFIVLLYNHQNKAEENVSTVESILSCLYQQNVINIVVVIPDKKNIRNAVIYSWKPYDPPQYCGYFNETAKNRLIVEMTCERGDSKNKRELFEDRVPASMKGCILEAIAIERQPFISRDEETLGIEKFIVNSLAKIYNFTTRYEILNSFRGERNELGKWDGALTSIVKKKGYILLGGIFPDFDVHEDFDYSHSYLSDTYAWVVPKAYPKPKWVSLLIIFKPIVWYSVVAGFLLCAISWKLLGTLSNEKSSYNKTLKHCIWNTWICTLGFCCYTRPVTKSLRVFFVFLNMYCVLCLTAYQTKLIDVLRNPSFEEQIDTIEELVASDLKMGGIEELRDLFFNSGDEFDQIIESKWIDVENLTKALIDVTVHKNFSVLCSRLELAYMTSIMSELSDGFGENTYFVFERNSFSAPIEMLALRGFVFIDKFSYLIALFKQLGAFSHVRHKMAAHNARMRAKLLSSIQNEWSKSKVNALSLQHLQGGFLALCLGFVCGTFTLSIEIFVNSNFVSFKIKQLKKYIKIK